ncbi:hypothetical protein IQ255_04995 [Pleurocapsales cyanobacterium LEGE 10410]|nr:hypothetical protein [Pleurocapsales cyanobacterium LEGE 10410]
MSSKIAIAIAHGICVGNEFDQEESSNLEGEWINFYNKSDVMGYPLKSLNQAYSEAVTEDQEVNAGGWLESWNPLSHCSYWTDESVVETIATGLHNVLQRLEESN